MTSRGGDMVENKDTRDKGAHDAKPASSPSSPPGQPLQSTTSQAPGVEDPDATKVAITEPVAKKAKTEGGDQQHDPQHKDKQPPNDKQSQHNTKDKQHPSSIVQTAVAAITNTTRDAVLWAEGDGPHQLTYTAQENLTSAQQTVKQHTTGVQQRAGQAVAVVVDKSKALVGAVEATVSGAVRGTLGGAGRLLHGAGDGLDKMAREETELEKEAGKGGQVGQASKMKPPSEEYEQQQHDNDKSPTTNNTNNTNTNNKEEQPPMQQETHQPEQPPKQGKEQEQTPKAVIDADDGVPLDNHPHGQHIGQRIGQHKLHSKM